MATIKKRGNSYLIRVSCGYDINGNHKEQSMTWKPDEGMTKKQIEKELNRQAVMFEESGNHGFKTSTMKFQELAEEWFENYAKNALRSITYERMLQAYPPCLSCDRASAYRQDNRKTFAGIRELSRQRGSERKDGQAPRTENDPS